MHSFLCDAHVHVYPFFNLRLVINLAIERLSSSPSKLGVMLLVERSDCHFFKSLSEGEIGIPDKGVSVETASRSEILLKDSSGRRLLIVAGRQVATKEGVELLCYGSDADLRDGVSFLNGVEQIVDLGAVAGLNWAPGKWMFSRYRIVEEILGQLGPNQLVVCDTALRPRGWPVPKLMAEAQREGFSVVYGSDPLPLVGDERVLASYRTEVYPGQEPQGYDSCSVPLECWRTLFIKGGINKPQGQRSSIIDFARRMYRLRSGSLSGK